MRGLRTFAPRMLLALMLVIGQAGAQVHAYSHLNNGPVDPGCLHTLCGQCLSSAALLSGAALSAPVFLPPCGREERITVAPASQVTAAPTHSGFRSRAPPILL